MINLCKIRTRKKMSQVSLSMKIGVAQETISAYESGRSYPSVDTLLKMCEIFNVSTDYLLDKTDIPTPVQNLLVDKLDSKELEMIALFRELTAGQRERVIGFALGLKEQ